MRSLNARQALNCEQAREPVCRCRCGGALHGAKRGGAEPDDSFFEGLPQNDPHHVAGEDERTETRRQAAEQRRRQRTELSERRWQAIQEVLRFEEV